MEIPQHSNDICRRVSLWCSRKPILVKNILVKTLCRGGQRREVSAGFYCKTTLGFVSASGLWLYNEVPGVRHEDTLWGQLTKPPPQVALVFGCQFKLWSVNRVVTWTRGGRTFPGTWGRYRRGRTRPPLRTPWRFSSVAASCWVFLPPTQATGEENKSEKGEEEQGRTVDERRGSGEAVRNTDTLLDGRGKKWKWERGNGDVLGPEYLSSLQFNLIFRSAAPLIKLVGSVEATVVGFTTFDSKDSSFVFLESQLESRSLQTWHMSCKCVMFPTEAVLIL